MKIRKIFPPRRKAWSVLATAALLAGSGCKNNNEGSPIEFTPGAMKSLPSVKSSTGTSSFALSPRTAKLALGTGSKFALSVGSSVADDFFTAQTFEMQCRHPDSGVNYCPPGTPAPPANTFDPYQFTMQALIGMVYHAQMYGGTLATACSGSPKTITASSYSAGSAAVGANPARFILDTFASYTCRSTNVSNPSAETRMISTAADGSYQATLHTRYRYDSGDGRPQTDLFQVDVAMNAGVPEFLALNFAAAIPHASRIVLLANLSNHRFALKYYDPSQPAGDCTQGPCPSTSPTRWIVAVGVGGYDLTTGNANPGYYFLHVQDPDIGGEAQRCVNNVGGEYQPDFTACTADSVPTSWTTSDVDVVSAYLDVPAAHATRLAPFLAVFQSDATLTPSDAWQIAGDEDLYWPASLQ